VSFKDKAAAVTYDDSKADVTALTTAAANAATRRPPGVELSMIIGSVITCPNCGTAKLETMPIDACRVFYECTGCRAMLRPKPGDCCVFCSYGSVPCPPVQTERSGEPSAASCCAT
jgi:hypothetical protein